MNEQQVSEFILYAKGEISALWESTKSAHKRIDETGELTASVNQLAQQVARVAEKVEHIADRMDKSIDRMEHGQKVQGERIGDIEKIVLTIERNEKAIAKHEQRLDDIDKEPAAKWKTLVAQVTSLVVAALIGVVVAKLL